MSQEVEPCSIKVSVKVSTGIVDGNQESAVDLPVIGGTFSLFVIQYISEHQ